MTHVYYADHFNIFIGSQINVSGKTVLLGETINCIIRNAEEDENKQSTY